MYMYYTALRVHVYKATLGKERWLTKALRGCMCIKPPEECMFTIHQGGTWMCQDMSIEVILYLREGSSLSES